MTILNLAFTLAALPVAIDGFVISSPLSRVPIVEPKRSSTRTFAVSKILGGLVKKNLPEAIKGVHLPDNEPISERLSDVISLNLFSNVNTVGYIVKSGDNRKDLLGKPKTSGSLKQARDVLMEAADLRNTVPNPGAYKFFGSDDNRANELTTILKTNAFMAMALTENDIGFELKSFDPDEKKPSRFLKFMRTLSGVGHRVNFQFDKKMNLVSFSVFDDIEGKELPGDLDVNKYASSALFNLLFFASSIHATIHVLHFLMTAAFDISANGFSEAQAWADTYEKNIVIKYIEVGVILMGDAPEDPSEPDLSLITGKDGFGSSQVVRPLLKELLNEWGTKPTVDGWFDSMFELSRKTMKEAGILEEHLKHVELVKPFADDAAAALKDIDAKKFNSLESKMTKYLKSCGDFKSTVNSLSEWLQIMTMTGITHGSTISYTRLMGTESVARWRSFMTEDWSAADLSLIVGGLGTITGMQPGRHVMSADTRGFFGYDAKLKAVLEEFDAKSTKLKEDYKNQLVEHPDFNDLGFLLTDFCPDDFDGKQLTMTTYI